MAFAYCLFSLIMIKGKRIILGITGGIAAYKCAYLVRQLVKEGAEVKVVMTPAATEFVSVKTLSVLSKNQVITDYFDQANNWNNHVALAEWADLIVLAPLTANTMAKMVTGICDNVLMAVLLSARSKIMVAPAMDLDMYKHPTTVNNLNTIESRGVSVIPAGTGELASGLYGEGRMAEPEAIAQTISDYFTSNLRFSGKKVLVNAGPTYEALDPVRFMGNRSTGKMGIAIADQFAKEGAKVILVLGPTHLSTTERSVEVRRVETSDQMYSACLTEFDTCDIVVCSAAVADFKPKHPSDIKIKKDKAAPTLDLTPTVDILKELGLRKTKQLLVGFALETENVTDYARGKLVSKNADMIVANSAIEKGSGFASDTNRISIVDRRNNLVNFELKPKTEVAKDIVEYIHQFMK